MYIMDKRSKVNSQLSDKVYDVTLDDIESADFEFNSDLYKVNVFGKNVHIAPGRPKKDKTYTGLTYFYVYVVKDETVVAKLGVYEKMTTENREIYDLTEFPDGSLLLFDIYYNMPALIDDFETEELGEEEELSVSKNVTIDGKKYTVKGEEVFDTTGRKVGNTIMNGKEVSWVWEKTGTPSPNFMAPSKINYGINYANESPAGEDFFEYLKQNIQTLNKKITLETQNRKSVLMRMKLRENNTIEQTKKDKYFELLTAITQNKMSIYDKAYIDNIKMIANSNTNSIISYEEQVMFLLYCVGAYINVNFEFKNKNNETIDYSEIKELKYNESATVTIVVQIKDKNVFFIENVGTSLNAPKKPPVIEPVNVTQPNVALNEPSPPFVVNEPSPPFVPNEGLNVPNEGLNLNVPNVSPNQGLNLNAPSKSNSSNEEKSSNMLGGKIKRGSNNIKLK